MQCLADTLLVGKSSSMLSIDSSCELKAEKIKVRICDGVSSRTSAILRHGQDIADEWEMGMNGGQPLPIIPKRINGG